MERHHQAYASGATNELQTLGGASQTLKLTTKIILKEKT